MKHIPYLLVGVAIVTLIGCGKTPGGSPIQSPSPEPTAVPIATPTPAPSPLPSGELYFQIPESDIQAMVNKKGEVRVLHYPKLFESTLTVAAKTWSHPVEEDPDKTKSPFTRFTCEKLETFAKVAGSTNPHLPEEAKRNALFWLRDAHEVLLKATLPHLPGLGSSYIPKFRTALGEKSSNFPTLTLLNPLSPSTIEFVAVQKKKESSLTFKAGHVEELKNRLGVFFNSIAPMETPFVQKPLAFRDVLCDLSEDAITLWFQISTTEKETPTTVNFHLTLNKEEQ